MTRKFLHEEEYRGEGQLAKLAQQSGSPFLAQASSQFIGCPSLADTPDPADWPKVNQST